MQAVDAAADVEGAPGSSKQSAEDPEWGLHVGDVVQIVQGRPEEWTYALYCGQGRVIHAWTPSRQSFRVRMDSLRALKASGYVATNCSRELDEFFRQLLNAKQVDPPEAIRRAKSALHTMAASRLSNLSLVLFARYGDAIFLLLKLLKEAYSSADAECLLRETSGERPDCLRICESPLNSLAHVGKSGNGRVRNNQIAESTQPAIKTFFGTNGEFLISEWLGRSLSDHFRNSCTSSKWYMIVMPPTNWLTLVFLLYNIPEASFQMRCNVACGLPQRLADDRMECGVCWMNFTSLRVMLLRCQHYLCSPCLRLLPRKECPYCRGSTESAEPVSEPIKRQALRLLVKAMELEGKPPAPGPETDQLAPAANAKDDNHRDQLPPNIHDELEDNH